MTARHHHYVPQCYLRGFAVERKKRKYQLLVYDRIARRSYPSATENVAQERDFNRFETESGPPDSFEAGLARFETALAPALKRTIAAAHFPNPDDRAYVLNLVGLIALRNPRWREQMRKLREQTSRVMMDMTLSSKERWEAQLKRAQASGDVAPDTSVTYEEMKALQREGSFRLEVATETHIQTELKGFDALLPYLDARKWIFLRAPKDSGGFITCDHPVLLTWTDPSMRGKFHPPGYGLKGTEVMFPLSHRVAMIGAFDIQDQTIDIPEEGVAGFNGGAVASAERQV
jgi:hypothetical protein